MRFRSNTFRDLSLLMQRAAKCLTMRKVTALTLPPAKAGVSRRRKTTNITIKLISYYMTMDGKN